MDIRNLFSGKTPGQGGLIYNPVQVGNAPVLDMKDPNIAQYLSAMGSMGASWVNSGVKAFLPGDLNYMDMDWSPMMNQFGDDQPSDPFARSPRNEEYYQYQDVLRDQLAGLAQHLGYNLDGYNLKDWSSADARYKPGSSVGAQPGKGLKELYTDLSTDLSGFHRIRGASAGWDGKGDARSTAETLYYDDGSGKYIPISDSRFGRKNEHKGWAREEGAETITGLSMVMPAFGGWAGLLGSGTAGTVTGLTGGLGLTTGLPAGLVNAGMGAMLGGGTGALINGLGGYLGAMGGEALGMSPQLGSQIGRFIARQINSGQGGGGSSGQGLAGLLAGLGAASGSGSGGSPTSGAVGSSVGSAGGGRVGLGSGLAGITSASSAFQPKFVDPTPEDIDPSKGTSSIMEALRNRSGNVKTSWFDQ